MAGVWTRARGLVLAPRADGAWFYEHDTASVIPGQAEPEPFHPTDRTTLRKIAAPTPNPTALVAAKERASR